MKSADDDPFVCTPPLLMKKRDQLFETLAAMSRDDLKAIYACSEKTFQPVWDELCRQKEGRIPPSTPALLAYDGIAFQYMSPGIFTQDEWDYVNDHLIILSAMYGALRPMDGVVPYRLEMAQKIPFSLYEYWSKDLTEVIDDPVIVCLASKEYARAIEPWQKLIHVRFFEEENGRRKEKGVYAKMARGAMVRWMAENKVENPEDLAHFSEMGYRYDPIASRPDLCVFVRKEELS